MNAPQLIETFIAYRITLDSKIICHIPLFKGNDIVADKFTMSDRQ